MPLTEGQLRSKRDEFWDTAPAFEGRKEIWDALRAAAVAAEALDFQLAQAILDGASVSVPNGYLTECYDEWGTRYQVLLLLIHHRHQQRELQLHQKILSIFMTRFMS